MARRSVPIEEKIESQKEVVSKAKDRYENELDKLEKLVQKRDELRSKELMEAFARGERSFEEVMRFLSGNEVDIEQEYNIPVSQEFREEVKVMCNLSTGIEERATKEATEETSEKFILNMHRKGYTLEQIADVAETSVDEIEAVIRRKETIIV